MKRVNKIDIHAHTVLSHDICSPVFLQRLNVLTTDELLKMYDELDIEFGVNLPLCSHEFDESPLNNENCCDVSIKSPDKFAWFCYVDPRTYEKEYQGKDLSDILSHHKSMGAKGVGEFTPNMYFDDPLLDKYFSHCEEVGMPVLLHFTSVICDGYGVVDDLNLPRLEKMLKKHKDLIFIGHSQPFWAEIGDDVTDENRGEYLKGKVREGRVAKLMREYGNLYCDISAGSGRSAIRRDPEYTARFFEEFSDRIMYGCDICNRTSRFMFEVRDFLNEMTDSGMISEENYAKIARENAIRTLKLDI
ncbi:MAG: hypothetical protein E7672_01010 [Ruminococcaceae bacterium]|nr:hypothetical protein [Oscillospiraceae bacterium]